MFWAPKFKGGIFSTCNQADLRKHICWSIGIKMSLPSSLPSFYISCGPPGTQGEFHWFFFSFHDVFPNQLSEKVKWNIFLSVESCWVATWGVATKFSSVRECRNRLRTLYKMLIPGPHPQILELCAGSVQAQDPACYTSVPSDSDAGDPWTTLRDTGQGSQADLR